MDDMVKAVVTKGKRIGTYTGRVAVHLGAVRATGSFNIQTAAHPPLYLPGLKAEVSRAN